MRNKIAIVFFFIVFFASNICSQEKVSDIINTQRPNVYKRWIANIDEVEYLIEEDDDETKISKLASDNREVLFNFKNRPFGESKIYQGDFCNGGTPLVYKDKFLIEVYSNTIFLTDIVKGELLKKIYIENDSLSINAINGRLLGDTIILIANSLSNHTKMIIVNLENDEYEISALNIKDNIYRIDEFIYLAEGTHLKSYSLKTKKSKTFFVNNTNINFISSFTNNCNTNIVFGTNDGSKLFYINDNNEIKDINVDMPKGVEKVFIKNDVAFINSNYNNQQFSSIYNLGSGKLVMTSNKEKWLAYDIPNLPSDNILMSNEGDYNCNGTHYIFDIKSMERKLLAGNYNPDKFLSTKSCIKNDKLYIVGYDEVELYGTILSLDVINFAKNTLDSVGFYGPSNLIEAPTKDTKDILFHYFKGDTLLVIATSFKNEVDLFSASFDQYRTSKKYSILKSINIGIDKINHSLIYKQMLFFTLDDGVYVINENKTAKIFEFKRSSKMVKFNDYLFAIVSIDNKEIGFIKIDLNDLNVKYSKLYLKKDTIEIFRFLTMEGAIFDLDYPYNEPESYFDLKTEKYKSLQYNNKIIRPFTLIASGENAIIKYFSQTKIFTLHFNTRTDQISSLDGIIYNNSRIISCGDGSFFFVPRNGNNALMKLESNLAVKNLFDVPDFPIYQDNGLSGIEGSVKTFPMQGTDKVIFISEKNSQVIHTNISFPGSLYYYPFFWKEKDDRVIAETTDEDKIHHTWTWRFGEKPIEIILPFSNFQIAEAIINKNDIVIIYYQQQSYDLQIIHYNIVDNYVADVKHVLRPKIPFFSSTNKVAILNDNHFLIAFNDGFYGLEPWVYNIKCHEFTMINDLFSGRVGSKPEYFQELGDYFYFTALDKEKSRQWFRIDKFELNSQNHQNCSMSKVVPNPSSSNIYVKNMLGENLFISAYKIYDVSGRVILSNEKFNELQVDINQLAKGLYVIKSNVGEKFYCAKFAKM